MILKYDGPAGEDDGPKYHLFDRYILCDDGGEPIRRAQSSDFNEIMASAAMADLEAAAIQLTQTQNPRSRPAEIVAGEWTLRYLLFTGNDKPDVITAPKKPGGADQDDADAA